MTSGVGPVEVLAGLRARDLGHALGDFREVRPGLRVSRCVRCGKLAYVSDGGSLKGR